MRGVQLRKDQLEQAIEKTTKMLSQRGVPVTQQGATAYVMFHPKTGKPIRINIPMIPDQPTELFMEALQGFIDHECAHVFYTDSLTSARLVNESKVKAGKNILSAMVNIAEDVRIEAEVVKEFPGAEANLNKTRQHIIETVWEPEFKKLQERVAAGDKQADMLLKGNGLVPFLRALGGQRLCAEMIDRLGMRPVFDGLLKKIPDLETKVRSMKSTADAFAIAEEIVLATEEDLPPPSPQFSPQLGQPPEEGDDGEDQRPGDEGEVEENMDGDGSAGDEDEPTLDEDQSDGPESDSGSDADEDQADEDGEGGEGSPEEPGEGESDDEGGEDCAGSEDADDKEGKGKGKGKSSEDGSEDDGESEEGEDGDVEGPPDDTADSSDLGDTGNAGGRGNVNKTLADAMRQLSPAQRRTLYLYNKKRQSIEQIADAMNISAAEVSDNLRNGRRRLSVIMRGGK